MGDKKKTQKEPTERVCSVGSLQRRPWPALEIRKRMEVERNPGVEDSEVTEGIRRSENYYGDRGLRNPSIQSINTLGHVSFTSF